MFDFTKKKENESKENPKSTLKVDFEEKQDFETAHSTSSHLGRAPTTIATAREYHKKQKRTNPVEYIENAIKNKENYYGQNFSNENEAFTIPKDEITHSLYTGSTGTGKGVVLGNRVFQSIKEGKGVVIFDPKNDTFLPQIVKETLEKEGRPNDFEMCYFPNKWGYKAITERDTYLEISNKMIDMFNYVESANPGVDHYRSLGRTLLRRIMKIFFVSFDLNVSIKKDFEDIQKHIIHLKEDLEKQKLYDIEIGKIRPNAELLENFAKRYFDPEILKSLYFAKSDVDTLDSLSIKFQEISEGVNFENNIDVADALYRGKVIYFRVDMNDVASLKWVKFAITDIIQNAKKKKANTDIYCDEISFYASKTLAGALATVRSMGLEFSLFLQAISQLDDEIKEDILENSNFKMFYKSSNLATLDYIKQVGGVEAITKLSSKDGVFSYSQDFEDYLNTTKIRALPRTSVAVIVSEYLPYPILIQTNFILTTKEFNWTEYINHGVEKEDFKSIKADENLNFDKKTTKKKLDKYRVYLKENKNLLENSDLFGVVLGSEKI